jgi:hypothetical protein
MTDGEIKTIVTADITPFEKKLQEAVKIAERFSKSMRITAKVDIDLSIYRKKLQAAKTIARSVSKDLKVKTTLEVDTPKFRDKLDKTRTTAEQFGKRIKATATVDADLKPFRAKLKQAQADAERFRAAVNKKLKSGGTSAISNVTKDLGDLKKVVTGLKDLATPLKMLKTNTTGLAARFTAIAKSLDNVATSTTSAVQGFNQVGMALLSVNNAMSAVNARVAQSANSVKAMTQSFRETNKYAIQAASGLDKVGSSADKAGGKVKKASKEVSFLDKLLESSGEAATLVTGPLGGVASRVNTVARAVKSGQLALVAFTTSLTVTGVVIAKSAKEALKFETSMLRLKGVIKATGGAAGVSAQEVRDFARELDLNTLGDALELEAAGAKLLAFRGVANSVFKDTLRVAQDFSSIGIGTVESNVRALGAALQDPEARLGRLERTFSVRFNPAVKDTIIALFKLGQRVEAQEMMMDELRKTTKDVASIMAGGTAGAIDTLALRWSELKRQVSESTGALKGVNKVALDLGERMRKATRWVKEFFSGLSPEEQLEDFEKDLQKKVSIIERLEARLIESRQGSGDEYLLVGRLKTLKDEAKVLRDQIKSMKDVLGISKAGDKAANEKKRRDSKVKQDELDAEEIARKEREKAKAEQNRLNSLREVSLRSMKEENKVLEHMLSINPDRLMTEKDIAEERERVSKLIRLGFDDSNISKLKEEYDLLKDKGEEYAAQALLKKQELDNTLKLKQSFKEELELNKELSDIVKARKEATAFQREQMSDRDALDIEIAAANKRLESLRAEGEARKAMQREAEIELRLKQRLLELDKQGIKLNDDLIAQAREEIALTVLSEEALKGVKIAYEETKEAQEKAIEAQVEFQETLASSFTELVFAGSEFKDVLADMLVTLSKAIVEAQTLALIQSSMGTSQTGGGGGVGFLLNALGTAFGGAFGGGGASSFDPNQAGPIDFSSTTSQLSSAGGGMGVGQNLSFSTGIQAHSGGKVGEIATRRSVPTSNFINAPRFHNGLRQNEVPAILERGEEVIPKDQVGRQRRMGDTNITFNVSTPNADSFKLSQRQLSRQARQAVSR